MSQAPATRIGLDGAAQEAGRRLGDLLAGREPDAPGAAPPSAGQRLGDYAVVRELGAGGMGTVLLAERADGSFHGQAAIKLIRGFPTEDGRRRLRRERQILAELDHPAIARLLDGGETADGQPYLVMEYVPGRGLLEHVAAAHLDRAARVALWCALAEAVAHAHQRLVIHRDLKPSNVLVRADGQPKLLDFGVAKLADLSEDASGASTRVFTPGYASPEQVAGRPVTTRTDVHALGTLLRELLLARRGDDRPSEPPIDAVPAGADLLAIIARARAEDPAERYPTADALLEDVRRWQRGLPVVARGPSVLYRARRLGWRFRGPLLLAALAGAAAVGFVLELRASRDQALAAEHEAREAQARAERSARRAERLLSFVTKTFEVAAPDRSLGEKLSVQQLLQAARAQIDEAAPEDQRDLLVLLGELHGELGERSRAAALIGTATAALAAPRTPEQGRWLAETLGRLAIQLASDDRPTEALAAGARAIALQQAHAPDDATLRRGLELALGAAHLHARESEEAIRQVVHIATATPAADPRLADDVLEASSIVAAAEELRVTAGRCFAGRSACAPSWPRCRRIIRGSASGSRRTPARWSCRAATWRRWSTAAARSRWWGPRCRSRAPAWPRCTTTWRSPPTRPASSRRRPRPWSGPSSSSTGSTRPACARSSC